MALASGSEIKNWPTTSFVESVFNAYEKNGNKIFLEDVKTGNKYTFTDLKLATSKIASTLINLGIGPGKIVTYFGSNSFEAYAFLYGVILSGGTVSPINQELKEDEISKLLDVTRPNLIYCVKDNLINVIEKAIKTINYKVQIMTPKIFEKYLVNDDIAKKYRPPKIINSSKHVFMIIYTSGTTGMPKAVRMTDHAVLVQCEYINWVQGKFLLTSPIYWISNSYLISKAMLIGSTIVNPDGNDPEKLLSVLQDFKVQCWFGGPSVLVEMAFLDNIKFYDLSSVEQVFTGGSHILTEHKLLIINKLFNGRNVLKMVYGSTEAGIVTEWPEPISSDLPEFESIGKPLPGVQIKIVDPESNKLLNFGETGEICISGVGFMAGYANKDLAGKELDADGWWHMGDIGYLDKNGYLYYVSRLKDIFKYRGIQIAPSELETMLIKHEDVIEACVIGKPHLIDGDWPIAFVVIKPNSKVTERELEEFVAERVSDAKKLRGGVHFLDALPKSSVGKILSRNLFKLLE